MNQMEKIRARLLAAERKTDVSSTFSDNTIFPFWEIPENETATIRFLPDGDESNDFFWRERQMIKIPFSGVKGVDEHKKIIVTVPCVEMWEGETCPVHAEIRPWFKDPTLEDTARTYWKKRSYIFQGFVVDSPMNEESTPENPIRRFQINGGIYKLIKGALLDPDFQEVPTHFELGTDFKLTKTKNGTYADYGSSSWARRERSLSEEEREAISQHGLFNLNDFMPKKPNADELAAIVEMFHASVNGELYDPYKWAKYYRPYGVKMPEDAVNGTGSAPAASESAPVSAPAPAETNDEIPFDPDPVVEESAPAASSTTSTSAQSILDSIRNRPQTN